MIALGELQNVDWDVFRFALENIAKMEGFEIKRVELVERKARFRCNRCGHEWGSTSSISRRKSAKQYILFQRLCMLMLDVQSVEVEISL